MEPLISESTTIEGALLQLGRGLISGLSKAKMNFLIKGLSSDYDIDNKVEELLKCIKSSEENENLIATLFRQISNSESPKVCVIFGLVIADHLKDDFKVSHEELILCKALESATDYDLNNFKIIMEKFIIENSYGRKVELSSELNSIESYISTCDWCVNNRIFKTLPAEYSEEDESLIIENQYYATKTSDALYNYLKRAKILWDEDKAI